MHRDRAVRALDHAERGAAVVRAYVRDLEEQLERTMRERDQLRSQLKAHRIALVQRVYQRTHEAEP